MQIVIRTQVALLMAIRVIRVIRGFQNFFLRARFSCRVVEVSEIVYAVCG
jgi:hypothetical protein